MHPGTGQPIIGIITANASQSEQRQLLTGIISQAQKLGAATAVFSNIYNSSDYFANTEIENKIYDLIGSERLDGLILTAESFLNADLQQSIYQKLLERTDTPIVVADAQLPDFPCISNDVRHDMEEIVRHLIEVDGYTDIDLLTGQYHIPTSHERAEGYRNMLEAHGIPFDERKVIWGNFWMSSGIELADEYAEGLRPLPQAIACANDYMAYGLLDAFLTKGIKVPDDVAVIGYEYIGERFYHAPILTTYQRSRHGVGAASVNMLWQLMTGETPAPVSIDGRIVPGDSCPCGTDPQQLRVELEEIRREQYYSRLNLVGTFEQELTLCHSIDDYVHVLQQFAYLIRDIKGLHLCLYEDWCSSAITDSAGIRHVADTMVYYRVIAEQSGPDEPLYFTKDALYPDILSLKASGDVMYFCPIFFSGRELGYFILQYQKPDSYDIIFRDWLKIAANALEFLRMKNDIHTLLECRSLSVFHDSVTGLYNKNGLEHELQRPLQDAAPDDSVQMVLVRTGLFTDSSRLDKQDINVRIALETTEYIKKNAVQKNVFCARIADNLYLLAAVGQYTPEDAAAMEDRLLTLISHAPLYKEQCNVDSLLTVGYHTAAKDFRFSEAYEACTALLQESIQTHSERRRHANYSAYIRLRSELYRQPHKEWDAQRTCRDFRLSYGHFRATYKELFGISFHQDVIRSRIALSKFLLLTTAMSLPAIAARCGYEDDKYFMRQFRQMTGMTPNLYRSSL